jgi:hypothetical protein
MMRLILNRLNFNARRKEEEQPRISDDTDEGNFFIRDIRDIRG